MARRLKARMVEKKLSLKRVVNEALRAGLAGVDRQRRVEFSVEPRSCQFKAGIDLDKLNQLVDELDAESALKGIQHSKPYLSASFD